MYKQRLQHLRGLLDDSGFDCLALVPGPTLFYLTGLQFHLSERPIIGIFSPSASPLIVLPELEKTRLDVLGWDGEVFSYGEQNESLVEAMRKAVHQLPKKEGLIGVEPLSFRAFELWLIQNYAQRATFRSAAELTTQLRLSKGSEEIAHIRKAVEIAEMSLQNTLSQFKPGMTERELAADLAVQLIATGSDPELPFQPIVASGPNSALPHAKPTDRAIRSGDLLILDWGARYNGYVSDITRTFAVEQVEPELQAIHAAVQQANAAGVVAARPGNTCGQVDRAAREVIEIAGYGDWFIHRTGHGLGLEPHEPPSLYAGNPQTLESGMVFTIEPGIYLPGKGGVRIEDNLAILESGTECLTDLPRELKVIG